MRTTTVKASAFKVHRSEGLSIPLPEIITTLAENTGTNPLYCARASENLINRKENKQIVNLI